MKEICVVVENPDGCSLGVREDVVMTPRINKGVDRKVFEKFCPSCNPSAVNKYPTLGRTVCYICGTSLKPRYPLRSFSEGGPTNNRIS